MDAGSSTIEMIPFIKAQNIVVVTNGLTHVEKLLNQGIKTLMIGGQVKETTFATVGASALDTLSRYCFDKAFLGMNGLDLKYGLTTPDEKEALIKEKAMEQANQSYVLLDHSKIDEVYFAHVPISQNHVEMVVSKQTIALSHFEQYKREVRVYRRVTMIYTVTFNPSIDYIMFTNGFEIKGLNRATSTYKFAGGKGINVSRVLKH